MSYVDISCFKSSSWGTAGTQEISGDECYACVLLLLLLLSTCVTFVTGFFLSTCGLLLPILQAINPKETFSYSRLWFGCVILSLQDSNVVSTQRVHYLGKITGIEALYGLACDVGGTFEVRSFPVAQPEV